jgi:Tfp pilus assembly protein PilV
MHPMRSRQRQLGTTLLEGLVAFLVLSLGMLSVVRVQTQLRVNSDIARQRSEAVRLAQEDLERMRAFSVIGAHAGARAYADLGSASAIVDAAHGQPGNTRFVLSREVAGGDVPNAKSATVSVAWDDRTGVAQRIVLSTLISASDPAYSGALSLAPRAPAVRAVAARAPTIPVGARDLGNGSSAFKPVSNGSEALLFDNATGSVTARCTGIDPALSNGALAADHLSQCEALRGYLLSGVVRFSGGVPPDPGSANDVPLPLSVALTLSGPSAAAAPPCTTEARKTVVYVSGGTTHIESVAASATAASVGAGSWTETGERFAAYYCVIAAPAANAGWSGRSTLVPAGWSIGTGPNDRRVCRFASDLDGSGAVDNNVEHPDVYSAVGGALTNQNFLVIKGNEACPSRPASLASAVDLATAQHQP